jgi:hypothetical protein
MGIVLGKGEKTSCVRLPKITPNCLLAVPTHVENDIGFFVLIHIFPRDTVISTL